MFDSESSFRVTNRLCIVCFPFLYKSSGLAWTFIYVFQEVFKDVKKGCGWKQAFVWSSLSFSNRMDAAWGAARYEVPLLSLYFRLLKRNRTNRESAKSALILHLFKKLFH